MTVLSKNMFQNVYSILPNFSDCFLHGYQTGQVTQPLQLSVTDE